VNRTIYKAILVFAVLAILVAGCAPAATPTPAADSSADGKIKVFAAFATPIEEPWDGVIHRALQEAQNNGEIEYTYTDNIGYSGDMERVLREICEKEKPDLIVGDGFGNEEAIRRVAADYPEIFFAFGSGSGPVEPNFSVFDNWIHEPGYLMGMYAGGLTESGVIGIVGPYPVPEATRIINAFIAGAKEVNPEVKVKISWINSWFDPAATKEAALAHIDNGADVIYGYPFGAIEAAQEHGLYTFGMMEDQNSLAPEYVVTSAVWDMAPTVEYLIKSVKTGTFTAQDLKDFSMIAKGGASLAPLHDLESKLPADLIAKVQQKENDIKNGTFRVDIDESVPTGD
jgi:basic membrane lipoprotein Med (substrate-binding protein (PBP1-ABC) superfamily)